MTTEAVSSQLPRQHQLAVARAVRIMENYEEISGVDIESSEDSTFVKFKLHVVLPSKAKAAGITKSGVKSVEPIAMEFLSQDSKQQFYSHRV